ncbi:Hsp20/alpha crystallin family protein [Pseudonocardia sp. T1-2H]|uniref:Hsp20/alpha crystallin family protein n=1 Tax=Pseudonocardia sp. T1-2H TaxID=3128899 RepID=UPI0031015B32
MRFDPFRELDRLAEQALAVGARATRSMPMEALRRGEEFLVFLDLPGVQRDDVDVTVERNVVSIRARRVPQRQEDDEVIVDERPYGEFARQLFLGENLDPSGLTADMDNGVLIMRIPVSEASKPRRVSLGSSETSQEIAGSMEGDRTSTSTSENATKTSS